MNRRHWLWIAFSAGGCAWHRDSMLALRSVKLGDDVDSGEKQSKSIVRERLIVHADFDFPADHALLEEMTALRARIDRKLGLPASEESIHVYLFENEEKFAKFTAKEFPKFPARRAFFVETRNRLNVYAHWNEAVADDLRHETTHGYVHAVVKTLPLWLDEGIAEYFETPAAAGGRNAGHIRLLAEMRAREGWLPDLTRLERLGSTADMRQIDYAESWLWTHWLLESSPARADLFRTYVREVRTIRSETPFSLRIRAAEVSPQRAIEDYCDALIAGPA